MGLENLYTPDCIRTFTGDYINVIDTTPDMIHIEDIAHALSHQCRFGGHLPVFFSVAQHSIECCAMAEDKYKMAALLHDASEAYLIDVPRPVKRRLANYKEIEDNLMLLIAEKFGFTYPLEPQVKNIDEIQLRYEWNHFMLNNPRNAICLTPMQAKQRFLSTYELLANK